MSAYTETFKASVFEELDYSIKNIFCETNFIKCDDTEFNADNLEKYVEQVEECIESYYNDVPMVWDEAYSYCKSIKALSVLTDFVYEETGSYHPPLHTIQLAVYLYARQNAQSYIDDLMEYADKTEKDDMEM